MQGWVRFEDIRRGGYDPVARVEEMDRDGVDAEMLYPTPRLANAIVANRDAEYHLAMVRAYNDWLSRIRRVHAPSASAGLRMLPNRGVDGAVEEIERVIGPAGHARRGHRVLPERDTSIEPEDDKVWRRARRAGHAVGHPRRTDAIDAGGAPGQAAGLRPLLRRAEPDDRDGVRRRVRPLPRARRGVRRGRLRLGALRQGADRQQLPAARAGQPLRPPAACRATTSPATSTSATSPTRSGSAISTTSAPSGSCGRATTRTSAPTGRTPGSVIQSSMSASRPTTGS